MQEIAKIGLSTMEGDTVPDQEEQKRQVNVYFPDSLHRDIQFKVLEIKGEDRGYSVTRFAEEASRLYLMVLRYHKEARSTQAPFDFTMDALKTFLDRKRK